MDSQVCVTIEFKLAVQYKVMYDMLGNSGVERGIGRHDLSWYADSSSHAILFLYFDDTDCAVLAWTMLLSYLTSPQLFIAACYGYANS